MDGLKAYHSATAVDVCVCVCPCLHSAQTSINAIPDVNPCLSAQHSAKSYNEIVCKLPESTWLI